jgi:3-hydroxyacyl-CoA dehydrogenase
VSARIFILGSGKMALDAGLFFLGRGRRVTWVSGSRERLEKIGRRARAALDRLARSGPVPDDAARTLPPGPLDLEETDIVFETTAEDLERKRAVIESTGAGRSGALVLSNASSILPSTIHPRAAGFHLFYPVELTMVAETIFPAGFPAPLRERTMGLARDCGLKTLVQDEDRAFAANRVLLPVQCEAVRLLLEGGPPAVVDDASSCTVLPRGQLTLMDGVGLDIILASVRNYVGRMRKEKAQDYAPLLDGLGRLVAEGRLGRKNGSGFLIGGPLPWPAAPLHEDIESCRKRFLRLLLDTCLQFVERNAVERGDMDVILKNVLGSSRTLETW